MKQSETYPNWGGSAPSEHPSASCGPPLTLEHYSTLTYPILTMGDCTQPRGIHQYDTNLTKSKTYFNHGGLHPPWSTYTILI